MALKQALSHCLPPSIRVAIWAWVDTAATEEIEETEVSIEMNPFATTPSTRCR